MQLIGTDLQRSTEMIVRIARHLPIGASLGDIVAVSPDGVMTTDGAAWSASDHYCTRMVQLSATTWEMTRFGDGEEVLRMIVHDREDAT